MYPEFDRTVKRERLLKILADRDAESLLLTSHGAVSWYLDGARTHTNLSGDPLLAVLVDRDRDTILTTNNEEQRLLAEELPTDVDVRSTPWNVPFIDSVTTPYLAERDIAGELRAARAHLLPHETERFSGLGREAAEVATSVLACSRPAQSERSLAAGLGAGLLERGIDPLVLLVAGASRLHHRHPLPTENTLGNRAMVVVCARRAGLIANLTRWVRFDAPTAADLERESNLLRVESVFLGASRPGARVGDVFTAGTNAYGMFAFDPAEWQRHHQGGPAGYNGRDPRATADVDDVLQLNQAVSWNPSVPRAKVEDTILITENGLRPLTVDAEWPTVDVLGLARPTELQL